MTLLSGALGAGRAHAATRATETLTVFYTTKSAEPDPVTGLYTDTEVPVHVGVLGRVKFPSMTVAERAQGAQVPAIQDVHIHVAVGSTPSVEKNHVWRVTASVVDDSLVGREFRTTGAQQAGQVSAWRYPTEEVI